MKTLILISFLFFFTILTDNSTQAQVFKDGILDSATITSAAPASSWLNNPRFSDNEVVVKRMTTNDSLGVYNITETNDTVLIWIRNQSTGTATAGIITGLTGTGIYSVMDNNIHRLLVKSIDAGAGVISGTRNILNRKIRY